MNFPSYSLECDIPKSVLGNRNDYIFLKYAHIQITISCSLNRSTTAQLFKHQLALSPPPSCYTSISTVSSSGSSAPRTGAPVFALLAGGSVASGSGSGSEVFLWWLQGWGGRGWGRGRCCCMNPDVYCWASPVSEAGPMTFTGFGVSRGGRLRRLWTVRRHVGVCIILILILLTSDWLLYWVDQWFLTLLVIRI